MLRLLLSLVWGVLFVALTLISVGNVEAQNPNWPNTSVTSPAELMDPANWPDDPDFGYDINGDGTSCIPGGGRCWTNETGGEWSQWSWVPPQAAAREGFREEEANLGAGAWADMAWTLHVGEKSTVIAVLDSGINWDHPDLVNQYVLNVVELEAAVAMDPDCMPERLRGSRDRDRDGYITMRDWFFDVADGQTLSQRIDSKGNQNGIADPGDLITFCSDNVDDDNSGYVDDISGWDFFNDDNDPSDDTRFGHGTGEALDSAAEANNGIGRAGFCPGCRLLMVRVGDSFVCDAQDYAQGVIFAVDSGASVIQEALGTINNSTFMRRANEYAYRNRALVVASAADENSYHHNYPGTSNHNIYVHANTYYGDRPQTSDSFLAFNNCTNYGAQLALSTPGTACSSEAVGNTSGVAGLMFSAAASESRPGGPLDPPLSAEEARQIMIGEADDIWVPESQPDHPDHNSDFYSSREGWDQRFGFGRLNAYRAVLAIQQGRIPPEVDIVSPAWFDPLYRTRAGTVVIEGSIAARRASSFDYVIEWAPGVEPGDDEWTEVTSETGRTTPLNGILANWDISSLDINNLNDGLHNRFTVTIRIRVAANYGGEIGTVNGVQRRAFSIAPDTTLLPGFPFALGVQNDVDAYQAASGESSPKLADIDGDGVLDIVVSDTDGLLHVVRHTGEELPGFPVQLARLRGYDPASLDNVLGSEAYASGAVPTNDLGAGLLATPAIGDLDGDGNIEIVSATIEGDVFVIEPDGTVRSGFPFALPEVPGGDPRRGGPSNPNSAVERGIYASPALADLDNDGSLEIIIAAFDGKIYAIDDDGEIHSGFPVEIVAPSLWENPGDAQPSRIVTSPAIGDVDGDGILDISVGSNEVGDVERGTGAVHLIHGDGNNHEGGPAHAGWPIEVASVNVFPFVGRGTTIASVMADLDGDGLSDVAVGGNGSPPSFYGRNGLVFAGDTFIGGRSDVTGGLNLPFLPVFGQGTFHDLDQDGVLEFVSGGGGPGLGLGLTGNSKVDFVHQVGVYRTSSGTPIIDGFPRVIGDFLFFASPSSADVSGDGYPEVVTGSGGYWVHAWDHCGNEAPGFPKFVGGWVSSSVATGDVDGDGLLEVVVTSRAGYLFVFDTDGPANGVIGWPEFRHDNHNTGNYNAPLAFGSNRGAEGPGSCDPGGEDAGPGDTGADVGGDAGVDARGDAGATTGIAGGGCGCSTAPGASDVPGLLVLVLVFGVLATLRRRSC